MRTLIALLATTTVGLTVGLAQAPPPPLPGVYELPRNVLMPSPPTAFNVTGPQGTMLVVELKRDGAISIDWAAVERNAAEDVVNPQNNVVAAAAIARLMLAIRDRTWRALP